MTDWFVVAMAVALLAAVVALAREIRLRKALERLLQIILSRWRTRGPQSQQDPEKSHSPLDADQRLR